MRICMVINPNSGKRRGVSVANEAAERLESSGLVVTKRVSQGPGGTRTIAESLNPDDWDGIVAVGGDGTLFEVINGLLSDGRPVSTPVGLIPVGTGNSFIKDLPPVSAASDTAGGTGTVNLLEEAVHRITHGSTIRVDCGQFTCEDGTFRFVNLLGAGFVSNVARRAGRYKFLGPLSYVMGVLEEVVGLKSTQMTITIDGTVHERDGVFVEICNSRFTGGNMMMAPEARIDDGFLDIILLNRVSRGTILRLLPTIFSGEHVNSPEVEVFRGRDISLVTQEPLRLTPDGEIFGTTPITVSVLPGHLEMFA